MLSIIIWNFNFAGLHKTLRGHNLTLSKCALWLPPAWVRSIRIYLTVQIVIVSDCRVTLEGVSNTTKSPHSKQCKLMIITVTLESALIQKAYQLWFQKHLIQIWMVKSEQQPSVMMTLMYKWVKWQLPLQQLYQLHTSLSDHVEALVCLCKL